jgi:hypothetical protein
MAIARGLDVSDNPKITEVLSTLLGYEADQMRKTERTCKPSATFDLIHLYITELYSAPLPKLNRFPQQMEAYQH